MIHRALSEQVNLGFYDADRISISLNETTQASDVEQLLRIVLGNEVSLRSLAELDALVINSDQQHTRGLPPPNGLSATPPLIVTTANTRMRYMKQSKPKTWP